MRHIHGKQYCDRQFNNLGEYVYTILAYIEKITPYFHITILFVVEANIGLKQSITEQAKADIIRLVHHEVES